MHVLILFTISAPPETILSKFVFKYNWKENLFNLNHIVKMMPWLCSKSTTFIPTSCHYRL